MTGPADDASDRPTQLRPAGADETLIAEPRTDTAADDVAPDPWYRNRLLLALWMVVVALLLTLVVYGIVGLSRDDGQTSGPAGSTSTSTPSRSSTTSASTTLTTTPPSTTETSPEPPEQTPENGPPPANGAPAPAEPPRHHHRPHIPSTITLPHTVITLPHGF